MSRKSQVLTLACGLVFLMGVRGCIPVVWVGTQGLWSSAANWMPFVPNGVTNAEIDGDPGDDGVPAGEEIIVTLDIDAQVQTLDMLDGAVLRGPQVDGETQQLTALCELVNEGTIRVDQGGTVILQSPLIRQGPGCAIGVLEAVAGPGGPISPRVLQIGIGNITQPVVVARGRLRAEGLEASVHLTSGVVLDDVCVGEAGGFDPAALGSDVVIADGSSPLFRTVMNDGVISFAAERNETFFVPDFGKQDNPLLLGSGRVVLNDEVFAIMGDPLEERTLVVSEPPLPGNMAQGLLDRFAFTSSCCGTLVCCDSVASEPPLTCTRPATARTYKNDAGHTISGKGRVVGNLDNSGVIVADSDRGQLTLAQGCFFSSGTLAARNGGTLEILNVTLSQSDTGWIMAEGNEAAFGTVSVVGGTIAATGPVAGNAVANGGILVLSGVDAVFNMCLNGPPVFSDVSAGSSRGPAGMIQVLGGAMVQIQVGLDLTGGTLQVSGVGTQVITPQVKLGEPDLDDTGNPVHPLVDIVVEVSSGATLQAVELLVETALGGRIEVNAGRLLADTASLGQNASLVVRDAEVVVSTSMPPASSSAAWFKSLEALADSSIDTDRLTLGDGGMASFSGTVQVRYAYDLKGIDANDLVWATDSELQFGPHADATLEVGGVGTGCPDSDATCLQDNFGINRLIVSKGATVRLVDCATNTSGAGTEALYLGAEPMVDDTDTFTLNCNGIPIYVCSDEGCTLLDDDTRKDVCADADSCVERSAECPAADAPCCDCP